MNDIPGQRHPRETRRTQSSEESREAPRYSRHTDDDCEHTKMANAAAQPPIQKLSHSLVDMPTNMRLFSLALRSLYAENAVSGTTEETKQINKLRDDTRRDAKIYANGILPICTDVVRAIKDFFENYQVLDFAEWKDELPYIIKELDGYIQMCAVAVKLMTPLKKRQDTARILLKKLAELTKEYDARVEQLEADALRKSWSAFALSLESAQGKLNNAATIAIRDALIPALTNFIEGMEAIAGFFSVMKQELTSFQGRGEALEGPRLKHFKTMQNEAGVIMGGCRKFFAVIPAMETDLEAIPDEGRDLNYVDKWLAEKEAEIRKEYQAAMSPHLTKFLESFANKKAINN